MIEAGAESQTKLNAAGRHIRESKTTITPKYAFGREPLPPEVYKNDNAIYTIAKDLGIETRSLVELVLSR